MTQERKVAGHIVPHKGGGYYTLIEGQENSPCHPCVGTSLSEVIADGEKAAERLGWECPYDWSEDERRPGRWTLRATYTGFKVRWAPDALLPPIVRGMEVRVTTSGLETRLALEGEDDPIAVRHEVAARLRVLLSGTWDGPEETRPDLDAFACLLQVPVADDIAGVGYGSLHATVQMSRRIRELAEAALEQVMAS